MATVRDLTGTKFGRLTVVTRQGTDKHGHALWICECICGKNVVVTGNGLVSGDTKSCGCLKMESVANLNKRHGMSNTRLHKIWKNMKQRCLNTENPHFADYGGRGITVCEEWKDDFQAFYQWATANGYKDGLTIERKNNDGDYCPQNCVWTTIDKQQRNKRNVRLITYNGETKTLTEWARELNIDYSTLHKRINYSHWSVEKAFQKSKKG